MSERATRQDEPARRSTSDDSDSADRASDRRVDPSETEAVDRSAQAGGRAAAEGESPNRAASADDDRSDETTSAVEDEDEDVLVAAVPQLAFVPIDDRVVASAPALGLAAAAATGAGASARPVGGPASKEGAAASLEGEVDLEVEGEAITSLDVEAAAGADSDASNSSTDSGGDNLAGGVVIDPVGDDHAGDRRFDGSNTTGTATNVARTAASAAASAPSQADPAALAASNERAARVLDQIRVFVKPGMRSASLELTPANLGRVDVQLTFDRGSVTAHLVVDAADTFEALQRHMPELRASLERSGLDVGSLDLSFAARDQSAPRDGRGESTNTNTSSHTRVGSTNELEARGVETVWLRPSTLTSERVDTLA